MSRPDLLDQLREARPIAPEEVRELVRRIAAEASPDRRKPRFTWRRFALVVVAPVTIAAVAAVTFLPGSGTRSGAPEPAQTNLSLGPPTKSPPVFAATGAASSQGKPATARVAVPAPSSNRVQRISTSLELRVASTADVSSGAQEAARITHALGGYESSIDVNASGRTGYANLVLRIPKEHLQAAVTRLSALGTVTGENVTIHDLQNQVDATARKIARLEARLKAWQEQFQTDDTQKHIAELTDAIGKLRRGRAATIHSASYATLTLQLSTRPAPTPVRQSGHHGPLHNLGVAFRWLGIGALYAVALAAPFILLGGLVWLVARTVRRRRENALLSSS